MIIKKGTAKASDAMPKRICCTTVGNSSIVSGTTSHEVLKFLNGPHALEEGILSKKQNRKKMFHQNVKIK